METQYKQTNPINDSCFESCFIFSVTSSKSPAGSKVSPQGPRRRSPKQVSSILHSVKSNRPRELKLIPSVVIVSFVYVPVDFAMYALPLSEHPETFFLSRSPFFGGRPFDRVSFPTSCT